MLSWTWVPDRTRLSVAPPIDDRRDQKRAVRSHQTTVQICEGADG
jgi:hypothetical protein